MKPKYITRTYQMFSIKHGQPASIQRHLRQLQREQRQLFFLILSISFRCGSVLCLLFSFIRWAFRCKLYCCCYFCYRFEVHTTPLNAKPVFCKPTKFCICIYACVWLHDGFSPFSVECDRKGYVGNMAIYAYICGRNSVGAWLLSLLAKRLLIQHIQFSTVHKFSFRFSSFHRFVVLSVASTSSWCLHFDLLSVFFNDHVKWMLFFALHHTTTQSKN